MKTKGDEAKIQPPLEATVEAVRPPRFTWVESAPGAASPPPTLLVDHKLIMLPSPEPPLMKKSILPCWDTVSPTNHNDAGRTIKFLQRQRDIDG